MFVVADDDVGSHDNTDKLLVDLFAWQLELTDGTVYFVDH